MQRYAPFIRATQCYFNRKILQHDSEDIYEGRTVIYYRTGESWLREDIVSIYENTLDAISTLEEDTLFRLRNVSLEEGYDVASAVQMMAVYTRGDTHRFYR